MGRDFIAIVTIFLEMLLGNWPIVFQTPQMDNPHHTVSGCVNNVNV